MIDWLIDCYYHSRQLGLLQITKTCNIITIYDRLVITILDNCYCNLQQVLQFTTEQLLHGTIRKDDF